jgi:plastocyanin
MDRRRYLRTVSAAAVAGLAGCAGQDADTPSNGDEDTPTATSTTEATSTPTESPTGEATTAGGGTPTDTPTPTPRPAVAAEVVVGPEGSFSFEPEEVTIAVGETVRWVWDSRGHNVKPDDIPSESDWSGTPGGGLDTFRAGHVYTHEFQVAGTFDYLCRPHRSSGMRGTVVVE